jgi:hypothetical protein
MYSDVWSFVEMKRWSVQYRFAAVELSIKTESVTATQHGVIQQYERLDAPSRNTLLLWVSKWCQEGSVKDRKPQGHPFMAHTLDNIKRVRDSILVNNQIDTLFSTYLFHFSTCFEQPSAHHQENQLYHYIVWYQEGTSSLLIGIPDSHLRE